MVVKKSFVNFFKSCGFPKGQSPLLVPPQSAGNTIAYHFYVFVLCHRALPPAHLVLFTPTNFVYEKPVENLFSTTKNFYFYSS